MFEAVEGLVDEHAELEQRLADPATHADQRLAKRLNQRYAELSADRRAPGASGRRSATTSRPPASSAAEDAAFAEEAEQLGARLADAEERLRHLLVPRDAADDKDAILEVKSGEGGEESALFAGDLLRMYTRYAERRGWTTEVLDATESDLGGYKSVTVAVKAKGTPEPGRGAVRPAEVRGRRAPRPAGAGHRVARAGCTPAPPASWCCPRPSRSTCTIDENDLRIDVFRSSGPGGQSVNTTDSAVRITHLPTGIVVSCQNEKSQLQNREQAMRILRARLLAAAQEEADAEASDARRSQVRTVDRSERIRTYNFPENRISDHRTGYKSYNLDQVLDGDLEPVIDSCVEADLAARLERARSSEPVPAGRCRRAAADRLARRPASPARARRRRAARARARHHPVAARRWSSRSTPPSAAGVRRPAWPGGRPASRCSTCPGPPRFRHVELAVGPGVFVPRPETELLAGWAIERAARGRPAPVVVDLCTGSGAIAQAVADEVPDARVHAVELDEPDAHALGRAQPRRHRRRPAARATWPTAFDDLAGTVDVVVCNPPYIPLDAWESVAPEARDHDPHLALFSGDDGLDAHAGARARAAALLLRPGGSGRRRARRRPGRVGPGGLRGAGPVERGPRPPRTWPVVRATSTARLAR